ASTDARGADAALQLVDIERGNLLALRRETGEQVWQPAEGGEAMILPLMEVGIIPPCPMVRTRRGIHLYLSGNVPAAKLRGIDIKSGNGFVVAPPSRRVDGGVYEWA
ncbi:hypothetical protein EBY67_01100, partial [bacterium]|nr:hypothetical protein [bacterium]